MAAVGFTPILVYASGTASNVPLAINLTSSASGSELALNYADGKLYYKDSGGVVQLLASKAGASGDVVGPASATDNAVARFDLTTGKLIQNSVVTIGDTGDVAGVVALTASGAVTLSGGTANGVAYLNASKVLTTGSALTFDGTNFNVVRAAATDQYMSLYADGTGPTLKFFGGAAGKIAGITADSASASMYFTNDGNKPFVYAINGSEQMRLTSTGLGIGTTSPAQKLVVSNAGAAGFEFDPANAIIQTYNRSSGAYIDMRQYALSIRFFTGSSPTETMRLDSSGNLGIGTSSPQSRLEVRQDQSGAITRVIANNNFANTGAGSSFDYYFGTTRLGGLTHAFAASAYLGFDVWSGSAATERMRLDSSGNLGLGVTPSAWSQGRAIELINPGYGFWNGSGSPASMYMLANTYFNSGFKYGGTGQASSYYQYQGAHVWSTAASGTAGNAISFTQAMTLDASGNLLVGRTTGTGANIDVYESASTDATIRIGNVQNAAVTAIGKQGATSYGATTAGDAFLYADNSLSIMSDNASGVIKFSTGGNTERMRLDSSGNLGLGVTPSAWAGGFKVFAIGGNNVWSTNDSNTLYFTQNAYFDGAFKYQGSSLAATKHEMANGAFTWSTAPSGTAGNAISFTQAMTLDASGNLLVGTTSSSVTSGVGHKIRPDAAAPFMGTVGSSTSGADVTYSLYSTGAAAYRFYVGYNGTISATTTTISGISDVRLKENIRDLDDGLAAVMALKPRKFDWKAGKGKDIKDDRGFIAQEFEQVFPDMIAEWKDPAPEGEEPYKAVNANLIPTLVRAIQELKAEFDAYKATHP